MPTIRVHLLPSLVDPAALSGSLVVVVDVLRATTTAVHALAAGARSIVPCLSIDDARRRAATFSPGDAILGGERGGLPIEGFDLGNSPAEYTAQIVLGKTVVLTTTNGTKALLHCQAADEIMLGAFVNLSAVCSRLAKHAREQNELRVDVVCAGTDGQMTREDVLFAGALAARLCDASWRVDDSAAIARDAWRGACGAAEDAEGKARLVDALFKSRGGRHLIAIGMADDIERSAQVDRFGIVPRFDPKTQAIQAMPTWHDAGDRVVDRNVP